MLPYQRRCGRVAWHTVRRSPSVWENGHCKLPAGHCATLAELEQLVLAAMSLMEFLLSHGDLISSGVYDEADVWDQFGVEVAPLVIDSVGFTRTTQAEGIVHFLTQLAHARSVIEQVLLPSCDNRFLL